MKKSLESLFSELTELDKRSAKYILRALEEHDQDGFDYLEYKQSLAGMAKLNMDEATRFQSTFVTGATLGLTRTRLLETAHFYKKVVEREKTKFDDALQHETTKKLASKKQKKEQLQKAIEEGYQKIQQLKKQIADAQTKIEKIDEDLNGAQGKIETAKASFEKAYTLILKQIQEDIDKIETYIT